MIDPDDFVDPDKAAEIAELDKLLSKLQDCDLDVWDQDFVDGMLKRLTLFSHRVNITPRQWEQLERLRSQYNA